jgi:hypothetical protein
LALGAVTARGLLKYFIIIRLSLRGVLVLGIRLHCEMKSGFGKNFINIINKKYMKKEKKKWKNKQSLNISDSCTS